MKNQKVDNIHFQMRVISESQPIIALSVEIEKMKKVSS